MQRHDGHNLHPRLNNAETFEITYREALGIGAIVPPKTTTPSFHLVNGETILEAVDRFVDPRNPLEFEAGLTKAIRDNRPPDFFRKAVAEWRKANNGEAFPTFAYASFIANAE